MRKKIHARQTRLKIKMRRAQRPKKLGVAATSRLPAKKRSTASPTPWLPPQTTKVHVARRSLARRKLDLRRLGRPPRRRPRSRTLFRRLASSPSHANLLPSPCPPH